MSRRLWAVVGAALAGWLAAAAGGADAPAEAVVTDADGKEVKVSGLRFALGTRRLAWLAGDPKQAPLALEVREPLSTAYAKGVVTLVPLAAVESVKYDYEKQTAAVAVKGLAEPLAATLQYKGINVLAFDGTAGGKAAKFSGGAFGKGNVKAVAFLGAAAAPGRKGGGAWLVQIDQPKAMNPTLKADNLKFLYQFPGGAEALLDAAPTYKGAPLKLDDTLAGLTPLAVDANTHAVAAEAQVGGAERLVLIPGTAEKDGKTGTLVGLVGEVEAGWKLFPLHAVKTLKRAKKD